MNRPTTPVSGSLKSRRNFLQSIGRWGRIISADFLGAQLLHPVGASRSAPFLNRASTRAATRGSVLGFTFIDIASQAGLGGALNVCGGVNGKKYLLEEMGCGLAFFDYDHDGWVDIFLPNGTRFEGLPSGPPPSNFLFRNNRDGTFTDVTQIAGLRRSGWAQGCCVGDYDNDGFDDLFVTYWGQNVLYHNNGNGTFTDVTEKSGLIQEGPRPKWNTGCCFLDYNRDGYLDLFVADYVNFDPRLAPLPGANQLCTFLGMPVACGPQGMGGGTNILYHNRGDGTFEDISEAAGITNPRGLAEPAYVGDHWIPVGSYGMSAVAADFDNDGWPDIYVSCDEARSLLYHNNHDGTFTELGAAAGCALNENGMTEGGMGIGVGDYDGDGWLDIVKPNFSDETISLYHNNGNGTFYDAVFQAGLGTSTRSVGWGAGFCDFDNDGWRDIFISTGHVYPELATQKLHVSFLEPKILYRNIGHGRFEDVSRKAGPDITQPRSSRGCAFADFDNDGDVDIVVINMNEPPSLLRNDCSSRNNWIKVKCIGTRSNRSAIGARVRVVTGGHSQIEEVMSGSSYISQNDFRLHFGLGNAVKVDQVEVRWPTGLAESFRGVEVNQLVTIQESRGIIKAEKFIRKKPA